MQGQWKRIRDGEWETFQAEVARREAELAGRELTPQESAELAYMRMRVAVERAARGEGEGETP